MGCRHPKGPPPQTPYNTIRLLCLGVGGCGKSTYIKQMKLIHHINWDSAELANYTRIIRGNIVNGLHDAIEEAKTAKIDVSSCPAIPFVKDIRPRDVDLSDPVVRANILNVFAHKGIQQAIFKHHDVEFSVEPEHLAHYINNMDRIASKDYVPTNEDILRCRQRTAGMSTTSMYMNKTYFEFTDVGGQKPEQRKWMQIIQENKFSAVLFFVACDEYDVCSYDDDRSKLVISRRIFMEVCNSDYFDHSIPIILLLNRKDIFHRRIAKEEGWDSFKNVFPEFQGLRESSGCLNFMANTFLQVLDSRQQTRNITVHHTCTLDTHAMQIIWETIRESLLQDLLERVGYM